ncbi:MAG TPA: ABC transporter permease [Nitriliruptorales bacterium]
MSESRGAKTTRTGPGVQEQEIPGLHVQPELEDGRRNRGLWIDAWRDLRRRPLFVIPAIIMLVYAVMALWPALFTGIDPLARGSCDLTRSLVTPSREHWFGFDLQGCDNYARTIYGAKISMAIGFSVITSALVVALIFGSIAGYYGGRLDTLIARLTDVVFALPFILGAIVIVSALRDSEFLGMKAAVDGALARGFFNLWFAAVLLGWPTMLRMVRSAVLQNKEADYVEAARALGASDFRIILRHILPNSIASVMVIATISVGGIIVAEAALSFLGVGIQQPNISWGLMISESQRRITTHPHLLIFPGAFLSVLAFSFIAMGDALRDALDPKLR